MKLLSTLATGFLVSVVSTVAHADLILDLAFADGTDAASVTSGSTVLVDMFLVDTDGSTPMSARGLSTGGGSISQTAGAATLVDNAATIAGFLGGETWFAPSLSAPPVPGLATALVANTFPTNVGIGTTAIHIVRFSLTATGAAGDTADITSAVLGGGFIGNFIAPSIVPPLPAVDLDTTVLVPGGAASFDSITLTIVVPEASTLFMAGLLAVGFVFWRRRRVNATQSC